MAREMAGGHREGRRGAGRQRKGCMVAKEFVLLIPWSINYGG